MNTDCALPVVTGKVAKAVIFTTPRHVVYGDVAVPELREFDVRIQTLVTGISVGTERWTLLGLRPEVQFPIVPGYLSVGRIDELGVGLSTAAIQESGLAIQDALRTGDRVVTFAARQPRGFPANWMCAHLAEQIVSVDPSEYSSEADLPYCIKVPDEIADEDAVFAGLGSVSKVGFDMLTVNPGMKAAVFGLGLVGQFSAQMLKNAGAEVTVIDLHPGRTLAAMNLGATLAVPAGARDFDRQIRTIVPGGFDVIVDTTGNANAVNGAIQYLRTGGQFLFQGWYPGVPGMDLNTFHNKSARVFFPCGLTAKGVRYCLKEAAGKRLSFSPLITHRFRPEEAETAYRLVLDNDPAALGLVFNWS